MAERISTEETPAIHLGSCCARFDINALARQILNCDDLQLHSTPAENTYRWRIENKYYSADVRLCVVAGVPGAASGMANCEAILLYIDATDRATFKRAVEKSWQQIVEDSVIPVRMLLCESLEAADVTPDFKEEVQTWCNGHQFEVIELDPVREGSGDDDEDSDYGELFGVQRIVEALNAHTWPNMALKEHKLAGPGSTDRDEPPAAVQIPIQTEAGKMNPGVAAADAGLLDDDPDDADRCQGGGGESFEQVFAKLNLMKEKANAMPKTERRQFAEDVVVSFWKAIHGDSAEIDGISDSDEDP